MTYMRYDIYLNAGAVGWKSGPGLKKLQEMTRKMSKIGVLEPAIFTYSKIFILFKLLSHFFHAFQDNWLTLVFASK